MAVLIYVKNNGGRIDNPYKKSITSDEQLGPEIIVCKFSVFSNFIKSGNEDVLTSKIEYSTNKQKEPTTITFSNLSGGKPFLKGNAGEAPLLVLKNDEDTVILAETTGFGDVFFYTIFPKAKVAVWQKAYNIINSPYGMVSMGYCD